MITIAQLIAAGVAPTQANTFAGALDEACARFDITTPARVAAFLGQCLVESARLVHLEESLFYRDPARVSSVFPRLFPTTADAIAFVRNPEKLANRVYAGVNGNGDEASGDGFRYRGRGVLQLTGRARYADAAAGLARPYLEQPELLAQPADACLTAAWYWHTNKLNALADAHAIDEITRAVNGRAMLQADVRRQCTEEAFRAFA